MDIRLAECQRVIGYHFANSELLEIAMRHSSLRTPDRECNERLEFLGDSVLGLVITEELYRLLPDQAEGELTRIKSAVVARGALYRASQTLGLAKFAEFARGVSRRDELPVSVTANLVEAVIGAIYLDAGFFPAREFVIRQLGHEIDDTLNDRGAKNFKSLLQHEIQQAAGATPTWRTIDEGGSDHRRPFVVATMIRGKEWGRGSGATKKEAEQEAARTALEAWQRRGRGRRRRHGEGQGGHDERPASAAPEPARSQAWEEPEAEGPPHPPALPLAGPPPATQPPPVQRPPAPPPPKRAPAPAPPPARVPLADDFAAGLPDVTPEPPARREKVQSKPAGSVPPRKRAPSSPTAPPPSGGFDSGL